MVLRESAEAITYLGRKHIQETIEKKQRKKDMKLYMAIVWIILDK